ncbi:MAG: hypothetical protein AAFV98_21420 [Chloroflexota bacterium]
MDYQSKFAPKKKDPLRPFLPIIGLLIMGIAGVVGWYVSPIVLDLGLQYDIIPAQVTGALTATELQYVVAGMIFLLIVALFATIYAVFAPKPERLVSEASLKKEREDKIAERRRIKARRGKMRRRMKDAKKKKTLK